MAAAPCPATSGSTVASTHILKPVRADAEKALLAESYGLALARHLGLTTFDSWVEDIDGLTVLVLERYDRQVSASGEVTRIHQEDTAQALSLPWRGDAKFEEYDARANLTAIAGTLDAGRSVFSGGEPDRHRLLRYTVFNVAIGNTDAHAKNFSILRPHRARPRLAPLYDVAPIALAYEVRKRLALNVGSQRIHALVTTDHLAAEAGGWGVDEQTARAIIAETLDQLIEATRTVPAPEAIRHNIPGHIREQAENLAAGRIAQLTGPVDPSLRGAIGTPPPAAPGHRPDGEGPDWVN